MKEQTYGGSNAVAPGNIEADPAAVFACATSLRRACQERQSQNPTFSISESYNGGDQFMREIMRVGELFEVWSAMHVSFESIEEVWPYLLEDKFADACLKARYPGSLSAFDESDCLVVARELRLPLHHKGGLAIPVDLRRRNISDASRFAHYQILSVREQLEDREVHPFGPLDDPTDESFGEIFYGLYGVGEHGDAEHIADRSGYDEARSLAHALVPGIGFPESPVFRPARAES